MLNKIYLERENKNGRRCMNHNGSFIYKNNRVNTKCKEDTHTHRKKYNISVFQKVE